MKKILSIGEVLWDMLPSGKCRGGAPLNLAAWAHRCGCEAALVSAVGNDELGRELAGDSITAVFLTDYLNGIDIPHAHRHAVENSAEVCKHPGAIGFE